MIDSSNTEQSNSESFKILLRALDLAKKIESDSATVVIHNTLAVKYGALSSTSLGAFHAKKALSLSRKMNNPNLISSSYRALSVLNYTQGNYPQTLEESKLAFKYASLDKNDKIMRNSIEMMAAAYHGMEMFDSSLFYLRKIITDYNHKKWLTYGNIASVLHSKGELDSAIYYCDLTSKLVPEEEKPYAVIHPNTIKALCLIEKGNLIDSKPLLDTAYALIDLAKMSNIKIDIYDGLSLWHQESGNYEIALQYKMKSFATKDSMRNLASKEQIAVLSEITKNEQAFANLQIQKEKNATLEAKDSLSSLKIAVLSSSIIILIILATVLVYRMKRIKNNNRIITKEIGDKTKLFSSVIYLNKSNRFLIKNILVELKELRKDVDPNLKPKVTNSIQEIENVLNTLQSVKYESQIKLDNKKYIQLISEKYKLSTTEINLILYLKSGLSSKEISIIRGITPSSVNVSRTRLRKKLGLRKEQNLQAFLNNF